MRHKHYDMIVAWAEGKTVQNFNDRRMCWEDLTGDPYWVDSFQYRIKPEPKPDVVESVTLWRTNGYDMRIVGEFRLVTDGETGKLKSAEVI